jgi:YegS/Rv2252/BmrU family lipid kinase
LKILLIVNPVAGRGRAPALAERAAALLDADGHAVEVVRTRAAGDAATAARSHEGRAECIVVLAGDGTLSEVVNGLRDPSATCLTQLPLGTANLLARDLALPRSPEQLTAVIRAGRLRRIDLGRVGARRFLLLASCGFDALVTRALRERRDRLGFRGYLRPIASAIRHYRPPRLEIEIDGSERLPGELVIVTNVRNYGGLFVAAEGARCDSGCLHVVVFRHAGRADLVRIAWAGLRRAVSRMPDVELRSALSVRIESGEPAPVEVDGDYWGSTPVTLEIEAGVVPVLVPGAPV